MAGAKLAPAEAPPPPFEEGDAPPPPGDTFRSRGAGMVRHAEELASARTYDVRGRLICSRGERWTVRGAEVAARARMSVEHDDVRVSGGR